LTVQPGANAGASDQMMMDTTMKSGTCFSRAGLLTLSVLALSVTLSARPASALDDDGKGSVLESFWDLVMPGDQPVEGNIQYRERAPIVVPTNRNALPQPQEPAAKRAQAWPKDQEIARKEAEKRANAKERVDEVWNPVNRSELDRVRSTKVQGPGTDKDCNEPLGRPCNQEAFWNGLRNAKSSGADDKTVLVVGQEPSRKALTEPPTGYRKPTTIQKYTFDAKKEDNLSDARAQAIEDARRREER
jgi:hypothetical protein